MKLISKLLLGGSLDVEALNAAERSTLMRVDDPWRQYSSFVLRLLAATVVATAGIAADSATTIIGAMLIAPLMSPMLGTALATALGRPLDALRTIGITVFGMVLVICVSAGVTAAIPVAVDMEANTQVLARVSPRLVDLIIACASGFVAALASMRSDIPDAVPGVAISASIVPPLCVVGAGLYEGAPRQALGAFVLFLANFIAIQVMGAVVYLLMGLGSKKYTVIDEQARRLWYTIVGICAVVLALLLSNASAGVVRRTASMRLVQHAASSWLAGTDYRVISLGLDGDELYLQIAGSGSVPSTDGLADLVSEAGGDLSGISVSVLEEERVELDR